MAFDVRVAFLKDLIDDASLFPPASLPMDEAVAAHEASRRSESGWMLGPFICPASRLPELANQLRDKETASPWWMSVILDGATGNGWLDGATADLSAARKFTSEFGGRARVWGLEVALPSTIDAPVLRQFLAAAKHAGFSDPVTAFLEISRLAPLRQTLQVIAEAGNEWREGSECCPVGAKVRCGGVSEELFPTPARVASFIHSCNRLGLPFKATAGLHHPFRHVDPETGFTQHGFVNLVGAAILASAHQLEERELEEVVADENPASFSLSPKHFSWRDLSASDSEILAARQNLFHSYGSCSFSEPVEDLTALGVLPL